MVRRFKSLSDSPGAFWIGSLLWLPAGVMLSAIVRFGDQLANPMGWMMMLAGVGSLILVAPCGLPLAFACRRLWRHGYRQAAWATMIGLGIVTVAATLLAGLLGPIAIAVYAIVLSLPVWLAVAMIGYLNRRRAQRAD